MGSWSAKPFDNDSALDWLGGLTDTGSKLIDLAFAEVLTATDCPDSPECEVAIAAAALICAACDRKFTSLPDQAKDWLIETGFTPNLSQLEQGILALKRSVTDSELLQLWIEAEDEKVWLRCVDKLKFKLELALVNPPKPAKPRPAPVPKLLARLIAAVQPNEVSKRRELLNTRLNALADVHEPLPDLVKEPPLCLLARQGLIPEALALLKRGADPNRHSKRQYGPLVYAALRNQAEMVSMLFAHGAQLTEQSRPNGFVRPDWQPYTFVPGLSCAARGGFIETLRAFLAAGADLCDVEPNGETLLFQAAVAKNPAPALAFLLAQGIDINHINCNNGTALHDAMLHNNLTAVEFLLAHGSDPNIREKYDGTALDMCDDQKGSLAQLIRSYGGELFRKVSPESS